MAPSKLIKIFHFPITSPFTYVSLLLLKSYRSNDKFNVTFIRFVVFENLLRNIIYRNIFHCGIADLFSFYLFLKKRNLEFDKVNIPSIKLLIGIFLFEFQG